MLLVEFGLGLAGSSADGGVEGTLVVELHAVVGVCVGGRVDSSVESDGSIESRDAGSRTDRAQLGVAIAASDDNVEGFTVCVLGTTELADIGGGLGTDGVAEKGTLDVGDWWGVGAGSRRVDRWVTLVVNVEAVAELLGVAEGSAGVYIVFSAIDGTIGEVVDLLTTSLEVLEVLNVAGGSASILSCLAKRGVFL